MKIKIIHELLIAEVAEIVTEAANNPYYTRLENAIGEFDDMQIKIVITRDEDEFCEDLACECVTKL
jgi:hypothetical protein